MSCMERTDPIYNSKGRCPCWPRLVGKTTVRDHTNPYSNPSPPQLPTEPMRLATRLYH